MTERELTEALANFRSTAEVVRHRPDPVHLSYLASGINSSLAVVDLPAGFAGHLRRGVVEGLIRLDALPRSDPFWNQTNRRPTESKLRDFASQALLTHPQPDWALWAEAALDWLDCSGDFGIGCYRELLNRGQFDPSWALSAAYSIRALCGYDPAEEFARFLNEVAANAAARGALEPWLYGDNEADRSWARRFRARCPVPFDRCWLDWNGLTIVNLVQTIDREHAYDLLPILADALEEAGCEQEDILRHCRQPGEHVRGCWVIDLLLSKS